VRESEPILLTPPTADAMRELGARLGAALLETHGPALCLALDGELGAGKTTLVGGMLAGMGIQGPVRSPTYTLIEPYEVNGRQLYHMDLYRLADPDELEPLGVRDLLTEDSILLIEWPSKAGPRLPPIDVEVGITYIDADEGRAVRLAGRSPEGIKALAQFLRRI
jgi:tRNA threonylcarbamoyladenosine biosynthesis protein TsaE